VWDESKNARLLRERGVSFEEVAELLSEKRYLDILEHPTRSEQMIFIVALKGYTYVVPFVIDPEGNFVLKTIYPSRKYHRRYGGTYETKA
jgi:uncharacterized DUF497 family protein